MTIMFVEGERFKTKFTSCSNAIKVTNDSGIEVTRFSSELLDEEFSGVNINKEELKGEALNFIKNVVKHIKELKDKPDDYFIPD